MAWGASAKPVAACSVLLPPPVRGGLGSGGRSVATTESSEPPPRPTSLADPPRKGEGERRVRAPIPRRLPRPMRGGKILAPVPRIVGRRRSPVLAPPPWRQRRTLPVLRSDARGSLRDAGIEQLLQRGRDRRQRLARRLGARRACRVLAFLRVRGISPCAEYGPPKAAREGRGARVSRALHRLGGPPTLRLK